LISDSKEEREQDDLQQQQDGPSQQEEPTHEQTLEKVRIPNKKCSKRRTNNKSKLIYEEKRSRLNKMIRLGISSFLHSKITITI
jgi:hypothetical protein